MFRFRRAEKSEALTENLQHLEKRVDAIKEACHRTGKRLLGIHQSQSTDQEKRLKKLTESQLSMSMLESAKILGDDNLLGQILLLCGDVQHDLAVAVLSHEYQIEEVVIQPIQKLLEVDIPNIKKAKKTLDKTVLDMDSAKQRHTSAQKAFQATGEGRNKMDAAKEEMEDQENRVEQARDQLSTEMYTFMSKESEYSQWFMNLMDSKAEYHRKALAMLEAQMPKMQEQFDRYTQVPVFGSSLEDHLKRTDRDIAVVIEQCVEALITLAMDEEGLFRIAGAASKVKKLKAAFDSNQVDMSDFVRDVHVIAGVLKLYLRELPEPLMTYKLYENWMQAAHKPHDQRLPQLQSLLHSLPEQNYKNLRYLIKFLALLAKNQEVNKMSPSNIAIVIGPNLIWPEGEGGPSVLSTSTQSSIIETFIANADYFFPGEIDFETGTNKTPPGTLRDHNPPDLVAFHPHSQTVGYVNQPIPTAPVNNSPPSLNVDSASLDGTSPKPSRKRVAPPVPQDRPVLNKSSDQVDSYASLERRVRPHAPPPLPPGKPEFPGHTSPKPDVTSHSPIKDLPYPVSPNAKPERPSRPPPERPSMPPPEKPEKPAKPDKPEKPARLSAEYPVTPTEKSNSLGHKRSGSDTGSISYDKTNSLTRSTDNLETVSERKSEYDNVQGRVTSDSNPELFSKNDNGAHPTKPPRPNPPPPPPRKGHGPREALYSDKSLDVEFDNLNNCERRENKQEEPTMSPQAENTQL